MQTRVTLNAVAAWTLMTVGLLIVLGVWVGAAPWLERYGAANFGTCLFIGGVLLHVSGMFARQLQRDRLSYELARMAREQAGRGNGDDKGNGGALRSVPKT